MFYKYLSDTFFVKVYDLLNDCEPDSIEEAQREYEKEYVGPDADDLIEDLKESVRYIIKPHLTFFALAEKAEKKTFIF